MTLVFAKKAVRDLDLLFLNFMHVSLDRKVFVSMAIIPDMYGLSSHACPVSPPGLPRSLLVKRKKALW